jgi:hypothetical protein
VRHVESLARLLATVYLRRLRARRARSTSQQADPCTQVEPAASSRFGSPNRVALSGPQSVHVGGPETRETHHAA